MATARFTVVVDFPTPPLPDATAMTAGMSSRSFAGADCFCWGEAFSFRLVGAVNTAVTDRTPGIAKITSSAALRIGSSLGPRSASTSMANPTFPFLLTTPEIILRATILSFRSGS